MVTIDYACETIQYGRETIQYGREMSTNRANTVASRKHSWDGTNPILGSLISRKHSPRNYCRDTKTVTIAETFNIYHQLEESA